MEVLVTLGRDSIVAYQNEASAKIEVLPLGTSIIRRRLLLSSEEVRRRDFQRQNNKIVGVISTGWSRRGRSAEEYSNVPLSFPL